ncbi:MAG TPA: MarR family transcriptional regulator [Gaiellaceae bacterium]|nr:MarR family transcriptional regulator [Gaiellaceae bacterium]
MRDEDRHPFPDVLGLARLRYTQRLRAQLAELGFGDFRRGDGAWVRILAHEPTTPGELASIMGVSPQAATKAADTLEERGYLTRRIDEGDRRRILLELTERGAAYAAAIVSVVEGVDEELRRSVSAADLDAAYRVLEAIAAE